MAPSCVAVSRAMSWGPMASPAKISTSAASPASCASSSA
uniref:Uncharacterized protein n=1 Tax=Anguilla anguilla TaxID=7936 RepID=A0A0E9UT66_ANGAN